MVDTDQMSDFFAVGFVNVFDFFLDACDGLVYGYSVFYVFPVSGCFVVGIGLVFGCVAVGFVFAFDCFSDPCVYRVFACLFVGVG